MLCPDLICQLNFFDSVQNELVSNIIRNYRKTVPDI